MTDLEFEHSLKLSYYKEIATLDVSHNIVMVQHVETSRTYVKKTLSLYNRDVYEELISHPVSGVPKIFEISEYEGKLIVIEEYISGITLEKLLEEKGKLSKDQVCSYGEILCDILIGLHSLTPPVIHRDIKPSNIILTDSEKLVLVDLNGAKLADPSQEKDTTLIGTTGYAAPEQYGFGSSNVQTDLYAVGRLMTCLLTGSPDNVEQCPDTLKGIIKKCIQLDPSKRYSSARQLKSALSKINVKTERFFIPYGLIACIIVFIAFICIIIFKVSAEFRSNSMSTYNNDKALPDNNTNGSLEDITEPVQLPASLSATLSPSPTIEAVNTPTITPTSVSPVVDNELDYTTPVGVYEGNDREKLVIADTGLAYYYCSSIEFTEVECPWSMTESNITITLSILHCDITADTENGFEELVFKSKSLNWNSEVFTKTSNDAASAILDPPPSPVKYVTLNRYGEKQFVLDKILFSIPKHFRVGTIDDLESLQTGQNTLAWTSVDDWVDGMLCFIDGDAGESDYNEAFISSIFFYPLTNISTEEAMEDPKTTAVNTTQNFLDKIQINYTDTIEVAGRFCPLVCVNGLYNSGFRGLSDYIMTGYIVLLPVKDNTGIVVIQMLQRAGMKQDNTVYFNKILEYASPYEK
ncbi:MAG: protein kinase [Lachnospiraceae bacterium]|nr:protein kinase [Lachnospiraceae bacterium]